MLQRAPAATNNSSVTPKKSGLKLQKKKILDHIDGWRALISDPAQLVTINMYHPVIPKVTPQQLAWSESWLSLHAREHSTDLFILFYSCPGHNHPGLAVCVLLNKCHIIDEFYNFALKAQGILGLHFDLGGI